jgi:hypothetical protein
VKQYLALCSATMWCNVLREMILSDAILADKFSSVMAKEITVIVDPIVILIHLITYSMSH